MKHFVIIIASAFCTVGQPRQTNPPNVPAPLKSRLGTELELESLFYGTLLSISKAEYGISPFGISVICKINPLTEHLSSHEWIWPKCMEQNISVSVIFQICSVIVLSRCSVCSYSYIRLDTFRLWFVYMSRLCSVHVLSTCYICSVYVLSVFFSFGPPGESTEWFRRKEGLRSTIEVQRRLS